MKKMTNYAKTIASTNASTMSKARTQIDGYKSSVDKAKSSLKELHQIAGNMEMSGLDPYKILPLKDAFVLLKDQAINTIPILGSVGQALKENLDGEYGNSLLMKLRDVSQKVVEVAGNVKSKMGEAFSNIKKNTTEKLSPLKEFFNNTSTVLGRCFSGLKKFVSGLKDVSKETKKTKKDASNFGKNLSSTFLNGISSIKKFTLGLLSVRTAFSMVSKAMQSYLSYDTQLANSVQNCWNVLGSLLASVLEFVISLFSKAVSYVNAFVQALTGINLVAKANKKAIDSQASSTKKLSEAQSSLDEFHTINEDSGGVGNENKLITVDSVDMDKLHFLFDWIKKAKELLATLFDPIKQAWENKGQVFIDSLKNAFDGIKNLGIAVFSSILEVWTNGTGQKYIENQLELFTNIFNIVGALSQVLVNAWTNAGNGTAIIQSIADIFIAIQDIVVSISNTLLNWVMSENFQIALNIVFEILRDLFGYVQEIASWIAAMYETYLAPVVDKVLDCISKIIIAIGSIWEFLKPVIDTIVDVILNILEPVIDGLCGIIGGIIDALGGVMDFITGVFTGDWNKAWEGIKAFLGGIIDAIASLFRGLFNTIGNIFKGAWDIIKSTWSVVSNWFNNAVIKPLTNLFNGIWNNLKNGAQDAWNSIKNIFSSVALFFKNIFSDAWNGVKNVFSSGGEIFIGIKDGIFNAFKSVVNTLIAGINKVVTIPFDSINSALRTIKNISFLGIEPFKGLIKLIDIPQIPSLETGGVLDKETIVRVAEYSNAKANPEIVSPRDIMKETMKEAIEESGMNNQSQQVDVNITGELTAKGDDLVYVYDKNKKDKGYDGGKNPSFAY